MQITLVIATEVELDMEKLTFYKFSSKCIEFSAWPRTQPSEELHNVIHVCPFSLLILTSRDAVSSEVPDNISLPDDLRTLLPCVFVFFRMNHVIGGYHRFDLLCRLISIIDPMFSKKKRQWDNFVLSDDSRDSQKYFVLLVLYRKF